MNSLFNAFNKLKVMIIGDVMIDSYIWGKVNRISPEAPVPIVSVVERDKRLGGAANVALNIKALGATPILCTVVGDDSESDTLVQLLKKQQITNSGIVKSENRITTIKHRILSGSQQMLRVDSEIESQINEAESKELFRLIKELIDTVDAIIFEDYDKGVLSSEIIKDVIELAIKQGIPTIVDPKKKNFLFYKDATLFKPNLKEIKEGLGIEINPSRKEEVNDAVAILNNKMPTENIMVTLSEHGVYITDHETYFNIKAHKREIADVSGAGDTVVSVAALCLTMKLPIQQVAAIANLAGGLVCEYLGVVPINKEQLFIEIKSSKILLI